MIDEGSPPRDVFMQQQQQDNHSRAINRLSDGLSQLALNPADAVRMEDDGLTDLILLTPVDEEFMGDDELPPGPAAGRNGLRQQHQGDGEEEIGGVLDMYQWFRE